MKKKVNIKIKSTVSYLKIFNGMFNLTDKEMLILSKFIDMYIELKSIKIDPFSAEIKKKIADDLQIDDFNTLNIYIKRLKDKNAIRKKDGTYQINPLLVKTDKETGVEFIWQTNQK